MIDYILPYLPELISAVITAVGVYLVKIISNNANKIETFKYNVLNRVNEANESVNTLTDSAKLSIDNAVEQIKNAAQEIKRNTEAIEQIQEQEKEIKTLYSNYEKRMIEIEAILRKED